MKVLVNKRTRNSQAEDNYEYFLESAFRTIKKIHVTKETEFSFSALKTPPTTEASDYHIPPKTPSTHPESTFDSAQPDLNSAQTDLNSAFYTNLFAQRQPQQTPDPTTPNSKPCKFACRSKYPIPMQPSENSYKLNPDLLNFIVPDLSINIQTNIKPTTIQLENNYSKKPKRIPLGLDLDKLIKLLYSYAKNPAILSQILKNPALFLKKFLKAHILDDNSTFSILREGTKGYKILFGKLEKMVVNVNSHLKKISNPTEDVTCTNHKNTELLISIDENDSLNSFSFSKKITEEINIVRTQYFNHLTSQVSPLVETGNIFMQAMKDAANQQCNKARFIASLNPSVIIAPSDFVPKKIRAVIGCFRRGCAPTGVKKQEGKSVC